LKSGRLILLGTSGPVQACNGIALPLPLFTYLACRDSSAGIATRLGLNGPAIESLNGEIFRNSQDRPKGLPSLLGLFPGGNAMSIHSHLAPRLKKVYRYNSTLPLGLHGLFWGELSFFIYLSGTYQTKVHACSLQDRKRTADADFSKVLNI